MSKELPIPAIYDPKKVVDLRYIKYGEITEQATDWRKRHNLRAQNSDNVRVGALFIDNQNTFCSPVGELFVAGKSGTAAIDDSRRLTEFVYRNLGIISEIHCTLDTHRTYAIFNPTFMVDENGRHPAPFTQVTAAEVAAGKWTVTPHLASALGVNLVTAQNHLLHYCKELEARGRYGLTIWPPHGQLGGVGHALTSGLEEAVQFHGVARGAQPGFEIKGTNPWTENYSVLGPEVLTTFGGRAIAQRNTKFIEHLLKYDVLVVAGQAKSHCLDWTIDDLLTEIVVQDPKLARKIYLLEDCTSPIVTPFVDYTAEADQAFDKFKAAGMHVVRSTDPISNWSGIRL